MSLKVERGQLASTIIVPPSKSYANRFLILAARRGNVLIENLPVADDVVHLTKALTQIGLKLEQAGSAVRIANSFPACEPENASAIQIDIGEGGTTARFLLALLSVGKRTYRLRLAGRLAERPWEELVDTLQKGGARVNRNGHVIEVTGPVDPKKLPKKISGARSTQFASALQLAFHEDRVKFEMIAATSSRAYWQLTEECQDAIDHQDKLKVPVDWSSAAYPLAWAAVTGQPIELPGLRHDPVQADAYFYDWLKQRGAALESVRASGLIDKSATSIDMSQCLDLVPAMAFVCAHLEGESKLSGLAGLVHKESDRLASVHQLLQQVGVEARIEGETLIIRGGVGKGPWNLSTPADHRLVMTAALFLRAHQGGTLEHPECVEKSFANYFKVMGL